MQPSYHYNDIRIQPDSTPVANPLTCADCGAQYMTAFGYVNIHDPRVEEKPMMYFANWVPGHTNDGITVLVGRGEFQGDEAVNLRAIAFSLTPWKDGWRIELVDADQTL